MPPRLFSFNKNFTGQWVTSLRQTGREGARGVGAREPQRRARRGQRSPPSCLPPRARAWTGSLPLPLPLKHLPCRLAHLWDTCDRCMHKNLRTKQPVRTQLYMLKQNYQVQSVFHKTVDGNVHLFGYFGIALVSAVIDKHEWKKIQAKSGFMNKLAILELTWNWEVSWKKYLN